MVFTLRLTYAELVLAYDEGLAERIRDLVREDLSRSDCICEKKMFGGLAFMCRDYMFIGVIGERLMARVGAADYQNALSERHVRPMDFTGKPLNGYVYVEPLGFESDADLATWLQRCFSFVQTLPEKKKK